MVRYRFSDKSTYGNLILDFKIPGEEVVKSFPKKGYIPKYKTCMNHFYIKGYWEDQKMKREIKKQKLKKMHQESRKINRYPRPEHFWAMVYHFCKMFQQEQLDKKNKEIVICGHYLAYRSKFGSNVGCQISVIYSSKISCLWKEEYLRFKKLKYNRYRKIIPILENIENYPFIRKNTDNILNKFIKIKYVSENHRNDPNVFNVKDLL